MESFFSEAGYLQWFSIGLLLVIFELALPGVYLVWFGFSAFVVGLLTLVWPLGLMEQLVWFALVSAVFAGLGFIVYRRLIKSHPVAEEYKNLNNPTAAYIGRIYPLATDVSGGRAKIAIGDSLWLAECPDSLQKGDRIKIVAVKDGVILVGEKV